MCPAIGFEDAAALHTSTSETIGLCAPRTRLAAAHSFFRLFCLIHQVTVNAEMAAARFCAQNKGLRDSLTARVRQATLDFSGIAGETVLVLIQTGRVFDSTASSTNSPRHIAAIAV